MGATGSRHERAMLGRGWLGNLRRSRPSSWRNMLANLFSAPSGNEESDEAVQEQSRNRSRPRVQEHEPGLLGESEVEGRSRGENGPGGR